MHCNRSNMSAILVCRAHLQRTLLATAYFVGLSFLVISGFRFYSWRFFQAHAVSHEQRVEEMIMAYSWWSSSLQLINGILHTISSLQYQIAHNEES